MLYTQESVGQTRVKRHYIIDKKGGRLLKLGHQGYHLPFSFLINIEEEKFPIIKLIKRWRGKREKAEDGRKSLKKKIPTLDAIA